MLKFIDLINEEAKVLRHGELTDKEVQKVQDEYLLN